MWTANFVSVTQSLPGDSRYQVYVTASFVSDDPKKAPITERNFSDNFDKDQMLAWVSARIASLNRCDVAFNTFQGVAPGPIDLPQN